MSSARTRLWCLLFIESKTLIQNTGWISVLDQRSQNATLPTEVVQCSGDSNP